MLFRVLVSISLVLVCSAFSANIDNKIEKSKKRLEQTKSAYSSMDKKLAHIAREISANRKKLKELDAAIARLDAEIQSGAERYKKGESRLKIIRRQIEELKKRRMEQERELVDLMANRYILGQIKKEKGVEVPKDVIEKEVLNLLVKVDSERLRSMQKEYEKTLLQSERLASEAAGIKEMIERLEKRKKRVAQEKRKRSELEKKLQKEKKRYQTRLVRLQKEESDLRKTLSKLKILKKRSRKKASKESQQRSRAIASGDKLAVRTIGSSYQRHAVGRYRGKKTISPVGRAKVVKKFGPYIDPVYKIKIFNESVTLQPYRKNAKVKSVLNGRVVFVKDTKMLGKVVIIEHKNDLHTIYAKMSKIAPTIREGKKIKKGYVIGRVEKELMFEVTQKERHINPLQLITVNR